MKIVTYDNYDNYVTVQILYGRAVLRKLLAFGNGRPVFAAGAAAAEMSAASV